MKRELEEIQMDAKRIMNSSVRGYKTEGRITRSNYRSVLPFTVDQGQLPICAYVTTAKTLLFNVMGMVMDVTLTPYEQKRMSALTKLFPIRADTDLVDRYLADANITPTSCTPKGFALIVLFFYFFDWLKKHKMRPVYFSGVLVKMLNDDGSPYKAKLAHLFDFLKLKTTRLGGQTFSANGWINQILERVSPTLETIHWKQISVCTLNSPFGTSVRTFLPEHFMQLRDILYEITQKFKVILTVRGIMGDRFLQHDVMIVGVEGNDLLISNSWGEFMDVVPINKFPRMVLGVNNYAWMCWAFQFTFLLPFSYPIPFESQYHLDNFDHFVDKMDTYFTQMEELPSVPVITPGLLETLALSPRAAVGGRTRRKRYTRFVRLRQ